MSEPVRFGCVTGITTFTAFERPPRWELTECRRERAVQGDKSVVAQAQGATAHRQTLTPRGQARWPQVGAGDRSVVALRPRLRDCGLRRQTQKIRILDEGGSWDSVDRRPNCHRLGMRHSKLIQPVIVVSTDRTKLSLAKRQVGVGIQTGGDPQGFR